MWFGKRYNNLNAFLREKFDEKVYKLALDAGFTCPNRDGTVGTEGCLFCSEAGSGEFAGNDQLSIVEQLENQKKKYQKKKANKFIAYFQSYTNTYASPDVLLRLYREALKVEGVVGIAIATRPDCIDVKTLEVLKEISKETYLWVELGLQTIHEETNQIINRGYSLDVFERAFAVLKRYNIDVVVHLIANLPFESREDFLASVSYISKKKPMGIKIHNLYILEDSKMHEYYQKHPFPFFSMEEYIQLICDAIERLDSAIVIHRLTGDAPQERLLLPKWGKQKIFVLNGIAQELKKRKTIQGKSV